MRNPLLGVALVITSALSGACQSPTCVSTCERYWAEDQCRAQASGLNEVELISDCIASCNEALNIPGPPPQPTDNRFNPNSPAGGERDNLQNENEAAAWMDCVWSYPDLETCRDPRTGVGTNCVSIP